MKRTYLMIVTLMAMLTSGCASLSDTPAPKLLIAELSRYTTNIEYSNGCQEYLIHNMLGAMIDPQEPLKIMTFCSNRGNLFAANEGKNYSSNDSFMIGCLRNAVEYTDGPVTENDAKAILEKCQGYFTERLNAKLDPKSSK